MSIKAYKAQLDKELVQLREELENYSYKPAPCSQKAAERIMGSVSNMIEKKMKLVVKREKSKETVASKVKFLGMTIIAAVAVISTKAMEMAKEKVKELLPRGSQLTVQERINKFNT